MTPSALLSKVKRVRTSQQGSSLAEVLLVLVLLSTALSAYRYWFAGTQAEVIKVTTSAPPSPCLDVELTTALLAQTGQVQQGYLDRVLPAHTQAPVAPQAEHCYE